MLIWLAGFLEQYLGAFAVVQYLTLRAILGTLTALGISLLMGPKVIRALNARQYGQTIRDDGPQSHLDKAGTPTMGGVLILLSVCLSTLLWSDLSNRYVLAILFVTIGFGVIGWVDDYRKIIEKNTAGLSAKAKYFWQSVVAIVVVVGLFQTHTLLVEQSLIVPFF